jgi:hypothetical protein
MPPSAGGRGGRNNTLILIGKEREVIQEIMFLNSFMWVSEKLIDINQPYPLLFWKRE